MLKVAIVRALSLVSVIVRGTDGLVIRVIKLVELLLLTLSVNNGGSRPLTV